MVFFLQAQCGCLHWFLHGVESLRSGVHVGCVWTHREHPSDGIRHAGHVCKVLHHLQPDHLLNTKTNLPQGNVQGPGQSMARLSKGLPLLPRPCEVLLPARDQGKTSHSPQTDSIQLLFEASDDSVEG